MNKIEELSSHVAFKELVKLSSIVEKSSKLALTEDQVKARLGA